MTNILIADDNAQSLYMLETVLKSCGYEVTSAKNGVETLELAIQNPPDLIVTDILMPEMDGFELCRRCKADERLQSIPLIFYTATYTDLKDEQFSLSLGADRFVVKPQQPEVLIQIIQEVLKKPLAAKQVSQKITSKDEKDVLQRYNEVLFRKLSQKVSQLEDIIEKQKRIESELRESEERYRSIYENSEDAIFLTAPDGRIFNASPAACRMFGYTEAEIIQMGRDSLVDYTDTRLPVALEERKRTGRFRGELTFLRRDGKPFPGEVYSVLFQDKNGQTRTSLIIRDMTERKWMEQERQRVAKLESISLLASGIAHDFNNILTAILGNISLAKTKTASGSEIHTWLEGAEKASIRAKDLTQQLLTFSKGGAPTKKLASLSELLKDTASFVLRGSNITCQFSIPEDLWYAEVDIGQISQVINNLVINARQAMPSGGTIKINAENITLKEGQNLRKNLPLKGGEYIKITVFDQGTGIPETHLDKIFDPFFTTKQTGSGLGLATSFSIIHKHEGTISVESKLGVGSTFNIYLPASAKTISAKKIEDEGTTHVNIDRILIMDDEESIRKIASDMLKHLGVKNIEVAANGADAIKLYSEAIKAGKPFNVVILDITIPGGMGGKETIQNLRDIDPKIKAIVSSGYATESLISEFKEYGFKGVVTKPYTIEQMSKVLREVCRNNQL